MSPALTMRTRVLRQKASSPTLKAKLRNAARWLSINGVNEYAAQGVSMLR